MTKGDFKLWLFPERSHSSTNKNSHFLGLENVTTFVWYPLIFAEKLGCLNKRRFLAPPYLTVPAQTPGVNPPLVWYIFDFICIGRCSYHQQKLLIRVFLENIYKKEFSRKEKCKAVVTNDILTIRTLDIKPLIPTKRVSPLLNW